MIGRALSILHLITRLERGGSADCTLLQAMGAARRGHRVDIASGPTSIPAPLAAVAHRQPGLRLLSLPSLAREMHPAADLRTLVAIWRLIRSGGYDLIHTHTSKAGALGRLAALLAGSSRRVIHQPHGHMFYGYYGAFGSRLVILAERLLAPLARIQVALSWRGVEEHLGRGVGWPGRFTVVRSGIDLRPFRKARRLREACRRRLGFSAGDQVVGTLCRLEAIKGVEDLAVAFALAAASRPRLRLLLAGDGPLRGRLEDWVRGAGLTGRVTLGGGWGPAEEILPAMDLFVMASRNEGMGRALVEAMACGLPVAACAVGGMPEVLEEGGSGLLVPPGDRQALSEAIGRLADNPQLAAGLAARARRRALAFGAGRMVRSLLRLYEEVAA